MRKRVQDQLHVPTPDAFMPFIREELARTLARFHSGEEAERVPDGVQQQLAYVADRVEATLHRRGHQYGEDVLFMMGEPGILMMLVMKALRMLWSMQDGAPSDAREDGYLDLAGYAVLQMAMARYAQTQHQMMLPLAESNGKDRGPDETTPNLVYLAGPITHASIDPNGWRQKVAMILTKAGFAVYNPAAAFLGSPLDRDTWLNLQPVNDTALKQSGVLLVGYSGDPSEGTDWEIGLANNDDKPAILLNLTDRQAGFRQYASQRWTNEHQGNLRETLEMYENDDLFRLPQAVLRAANRDPDELPAEDTGAGDVYDTGEGSQTGGPYDTGE